MIKEDDPEGTAKVVIEYTLLKTKDEIDWDVETMEAKIPEAHGNLNHVCRVVDGKGHSIYIKQAGDTLRISEDMTATLDRNRQESEILQLEEKMAPGMVPHIYFFDTTMSACGMEDCSDFQVMRDAMLEHKTFPHFAEHVAEFMVKTLLLSSDVVMDHREKKELVRRFITPDLDDITEKLVLMEPYLGADRNNVFEPNRAFVEKELYGDEALHLEVSKLKFKFMNDAQALLHGDLHTGSVFINPEKTKIFDCEFGTYAPMGYDIGNVVANLIFAYDNGLSTDDKPFCDWVLKTIEETMDCFVELFKKTYDEAVTEPMAKVPGFKDWYLAGILRDTAGYAGTELHRRTVGMANVVDVTTIADEKKRLLAERINILAGKDYILHQDSFVTGKDFADAVVRATEKALATLE
ncbi:MAG: S-methyl-5-thioribose kinase [Eubacteriales bacterium]|nr:S-methyl-5-thioribose kinase [Eubacteriales bacterium]